MNFDFLKDMNIGNFDKDEAMNKIGDIGEAIKTNTDLAKYQELINDFLDLVKDYYNGKYKGIEKKNMLFIISGLLIVLYPNSYKQNAFFIIASKIFGVSILVKAIGEEVTKYREWKKNLISIETDLGTIEYNDEEF
ncbi:hypothetical protein [Fenollaria sporofastidiosus]|uniref:hypothetical protein n=1 Tax=Fenollaria sporofastidiosus TaxID=2811778 RepID=UPI001C0065B7|nr:hypothetical protein [Fenollaria sporofastidiosus]